MKLVASVLPTLFPHIMLHIYMFSYRDFVILGKIYPALMGSKTPTSKFSESKESRWGAGYP
ncbi:hypothetical protein FJ659_25960 [Bacillus dicomae]|uniref:Uncharacterized protein n=1 Tax=Bacillus dicomae TaxID=3088378 RepID=A0AC61SYU8_9BACI|nr:hypothetical protein FJ659_25960 [Bacillus dicomae]